MTVIRQRNWQIRRLCIADGDYSGGRRSGSISIRYTRPQINFYVEILRDIYINIGPEIISFENSLRFILCEIGMFVVAALLIIVGHYIITCPIGSSSYRKTVILLHSGLKCIVEIIVIISQAVRIIPFRSPIVGNRFLRKKG